MLITWKQNLKHLSKDEYKLLKEMCHLSKDVYNESLYNIRQHYFKENVFLRYESNYPIEKLSENYKLLGANLAQQTMKCVDSAFRSFFALLKLVEKKQYSRDAVRIPHRHPKAFPQTSLNNTPLRRLRQDSYAVRAKANRLAHRCSCRKCNT